MREIKFRAWSIDRNCFIVSDELAFKYYSGNIQWVDSSLTTWAAMSTNFVLEQYTGLKDKNGVEIYEGDNVNVDGMVGIVSFTGGKWGVFGKHGVNSLFRYRSKDIEVIGNIHEE